MSITPETQVREIACAQPSSVRVFEKAGIDYCCGGARKLSDVCAANNLPLDELLQRLAQAEAEAQTLKNGEDWSLKPLWVLMKHIVEKHHAYVRENDVRLQALIEKVLSRHGDTTPDLAEIRQKFAELRTDMAHHMMKEEQVLFPYIERMEKAVFAGQSVPPAFFGTVRNPVQAMMNDHDGAGDLVKQIRQLTNGYAVPEGACPTYQAMLRGLEEFERDLHQHVHLENNILFPRAVRMEQEGR